MVTPLSSSQIALIVLIVRMARTTGGEQSKNGSLSNMVKATTASIATPEPISCCICSLNLDQFTVIERQEHYECHFGNGEQGITLGRHSADKIYL